jgi:hypothetical protein
MKKIFEKSKKVVILIAALAIFSQANAYYLNFMPSKLPAYMLGIGISFDKNEKTSFTIDSDLGFYKYKYDKSYQSTYIIQNLRGSFIFYEKIYKCFFI